MYVWIIPYTIAEGEDYDSGPFSITIPAGDTSASFNVSIMIDNIFESDESFNLMINSSSFPGRVSLQPDCVPRITIVNDESKLLSFDLKYHHFYLYIFIAVFVRFVNTAYNVYEDVGIVELQLALSNPSSFVETVQVINNDVSTKGTYAM